MFVFNIQKLRKVACIMALMPLLVVTGCVTDDTRGTHIDDRTRDTPPPDYDRFRAGQSISVLLSDYPSGPAKYDQKVAENGEIVLHLNQKFTAVGKTPTQLQTEIRDRYVPQYYPRMTVLVTQEGQFIFVQGYVERDGRYPYSSDMTVMKAISTAGGFNPFARKTKVEVTRLNGQTVIVDCEKAKKNARFDLPIYPGDRINVPRRHY